MRPNSNIKKKKKLKICLVVNYLILLYCIKENQKGPLSPNCFFIHFRYINVQVKNYQYR